MRIRTKKSLIIRSVALWTIVALALASGGLGLYQLLRPNPSPLPHAIEQQLTFSPFVIPTSVKNITTSSYKFSTAEDSVQVLSYLAKIDARTVTISEYTQPAQFTEIPDFKTTFLSNAIKQYASVQTSNGTVYLGRLSKQNNAQVGVMIERGLLLFMRPDDDLTQVQWRMLGDQFEIEKTNE